MQIEKVFRAATAGAHQPIPTFNALLDKVIKESDYSLEENNKGANYSKQGLWYEPKTRYEYEKEKKQQRENPQQNEGDKTSELENQESMIKQHPSDEEILQLFIKERPELEAEILKDPMDAIAAWKEGH